jgi:nucleoside-diphosphate-sugar epimerase
MVERTALVTGVTGFIGERLVPVLLQRGMTVRACGRSPRPASLPASVDYQTIDLAGDEDLSALLYEVTHLFHLAGASSSLATEEEMHRANVVTTERLVDAALQSESIERLLYMSSTSVYGEEIVLPSPLGEDIEPQPSRAYGKSKWEAEQVVWAARQEGLPIIIVRPVSVFGPGNVKLLGSAVLDAAIERFAGAKALAVPEAAIEQRLVHINDVVRATLHLSIHPWSPGEAFNVVFPSYPSSHHVAEVIAQELDMAVEVSAEAECGLSFDERSATRDEMLAKGMAPDILLTNERFRFMRKANPNNRLSIDALLSTGFQFLDEDLDTGIRSTIAWYQEQRWIV